MILSPLNLGICGNLVVTRPWVICSISAITDPSRTRTIPRPRKTEAELQVEFKASPHLPGWKTLEPISNSNSNSHSNLGKLKRISNWNAKPISNSNSNPNTPRQKPWSPSLIQSHHLPWKNVVKPQLEFKAEPDFVLELQPEPNGKTL